MQTVPNSIRGSKSAIETVDIKLQSKLIDVWTDHSIPDFYQNLFLNHIKRLPVTEAQTQIKQEIKLIQKYGSYVQLLLKVLKEKAKIQEFIILSIQTEKSKNVEIDFSHFCQCVSQLRDINYRAAFYLNKIRQKYEETDDINKSPERLFFNTFAIKLDKFRRALAKSPISKYITWQDEYDPFLISIKQQNNPIYPKNNQAIQQLFSIPLDQSYKYLKMKKILLTWLPIDRPRKDIGKQDYLPSIEPNRHNGLTPIKYDQANERNMDIQKLKQNIKEEFQILKRSHSPTYLEEEYNRIDRNKTRYFRSSPYKDRNDDRLISVNRMFNGYGNQQPELVYKGYGKDHFNALMNSPFSMPSKKDRKSEDVGRIKRSRVSQLTSDITYNNFKRNSRIATQNKDYIVDNTVHYRPQRLQTISYIPKKTSLPNNFSNEYSEQSYQRGKRLPLSRSHANSRQLENSLMINIMISPMKEKKSGRDKTIGGDMSSPGQRNNREQSSGRSMQKDKSSGNRYQTVTPQRRESIVQLYSKELSNNQARNNEATNKSKDKGQIVGDNNRYQQSPMQNKEEETRRRELKQSTLLPTNKQQITLSNQRKNANSNRQNANVVEAKSSERSQYPPNYQNPPGNMQPQTTQSQSPSELYTTVRQEKNSKAQIYQDNQNNNISMSNSTANNLTYRGNQINPPLKSAATFTSPQNNEQTSPYRQQTKPQQQPYEKLDKQGQNHVVSSPLNKRSQPKTQQSEYMIKVTPSSKQIQKQKEIIQPKTVETQKSPQQKTSQTKAYPQPKSVSESKPLVESNTNSKQTQEKKQIKIKIGKMTYNSLVQYINTYQIHPQYKGIYDLNKILKETEYQQTYLTEFTVNNEPGALALSSLVPPNSNFAIRLWIINKNIDRSLSIILFKKYIQLVQKYITAPVIFFKGEQMEQIKSLSFQFKKEKLYSKGRVTKPREIERQFQNFLNCQCSHINFQQKQKEDILFSQQIQNFSEGNSYAAQYLFKIENNSPPQKLNFLLNIHKNVPNFVKVNKLLADIDFDGYEVNKTITIESIDLMTFAYHTQVKDPFIACDGFFKFYGIEVISSNDKHLYFVNLSKNNGKMYFGRGFSSIQAFSKSLNSDSAKRGLFSVPMFTKNLYGRYAKIAQNQKGFYGNWQFSLVWQDEMQGRLKHTTEKGFSFTNQPFYVGLQIEGNLLYCFEVINDDFLF